VRVLIGARGLLPLRDLLEAARGPDGLPVLGFPSLLRFPALATDTALVGGTFLGAALALLALAGVRPRLCFALGTGLYLSYAVACRSFLAFQWDNLLLETGLLAAFLPGHRAAPAVHLLLRVVLFKLYFESGLAKWQSWLGDWKDGSAMTFYYETAPLPTWVGWYAHNLPAWWHHFESRATLVLELVVPLAIFGPRPARLGACAVFTAFQAVNAATANYGFFCYLSAALHVFLLEDRDVERAGRWLGERRALARLGGAAAALATRVRWAVWQRGRDEGGRAWLRAIPERVRRGAWRAGTAAGLAAHLGISLVQGLDRFGEPGPVLQALLPAQRIWAPLRLVNTYHLFAAVTRERIEPELQVEVAGAWRALPLWHKPGAPGRPPNFVAPHQPRVDFLFWFHGLDFQRGAPAWVATLVDRLCKRPRAVQPLFRDPLPTLPDAARLVYWRYEFTTPAERRRDGDVWRRSLLHTGEPVSCDR
jgi:hypothetical protein